MHTFLNFSQFLAMGGYAMYVWSAYGIAISILLINIVVSRRHRRYTIKTLQERLRSSNYDTSQKKT